MTQPYQIATPTAEDLAIYRRRATSQSARDYVAVNMAYAGDREAQSNGANLPIMTSLSKNVTVAHMVMNRIHATHLHSDRPATAVREDKHPRLITAGNWKPAVY